MKSTFIQFVQKYKESKLSDSRLLTLWKLEIDKEDFDRNEKECFRWLKEQRRKIKKMKSL